MEICFNLIFHSLDGFDKVVQLSYEPCPIWSINREVLLNPNPESPYYQKGSFAGILDYFNEHHSDCISPDTNITIVSKCNENTNSELIKLVEDIRSEGYSVRVLL